MNPLFICRFCESNELRLNRLCKQLQILFQIDPLPEMELICEKRVEKVEAFNDFRENCRRVDAKIREKILKCEVLLKWDLTDIEHSHVIDDEQSEIRRMVYSSEHEKHNHIMSSHVKIIAKNLYKILN